MAQIHRFQLLIEAKVLVLVLCDSTLDALLFQAF